MTHNPLQAYFRQPKIYLKLPTMGIYNDPNFVKGDVSNIPIYGMTGMDHVMVKTPDALLNGESTVTIANSCCPNISDAWELTTIDMDSVLVAIKIATYGDIMKVTSVCSSCNSENLYDIDISNFISFYETCVFTSSVSINDLIIKLKPLSYKNMTMFSIENFSLQKQLGQLSNLDDQTYQDELKRLIREFGRLKNKIITANIDQIETTSTVVTESIHISEFIDNCDKLIIDKIKETIDNNNKSRILPIPTAKCTNCNAINNITIDLDNSNFFDQA